MRRAKLTPAAKLLRERRDRVIQAARDLRSSLFGDQLMALLQAVDDLDRIDQSQESVYPHDNNVDFRGICGRCSEMADPDYEPDPEVCAHPECNNDCEESAFCHGCKEYFCPDHRLKEKHDASKHWEDDPED